MAQRGRRDGTDMVAGHALGAVQRGQRAGRPHQGELAAQPVRAERQAQRGAGFEHRIGHIERFEMGAA